MRQKEFEMIAFLPRSFASSSLGQWLFKVLLVAILGCWGASLAVAQTAQSAQTVSGNNADLLSMTKRSPLAPLPLGSPRAAFENFQTLSQAAIDTIQKAIDVASNNDAFFDTPRVKALKAQGLKELLEASETMDLSSVPPASRRTVALDSVLLLKEILERIDLPPTSQIPLTVESAPKNGHPSWTIPGTEIRLVGLPDSNGNLRYKFSSDTVQRLPAFYALVRNLPQKSGNSIDFYRTFTLGPGLSAPIELYSYLTRLPPAFLKDYAGQAAWQWIAFSFVTLVFLGLSVFLLMRVFRRSAKRSHANRVILFLALTALLAIYRGLNDDIINMTGQVQSVIEVTVLILEGLTLSALVVLVFNSLATLILHLPGSSREGLDASLVRLAMRVLGIVLAGFILATVATRLGMPLYGVFASLGVGGLALALAVRPTLENFIGGIILYADRPVSVGDMCKFGAVQGTVEAIGLRSTKIRAVDRTLVTVQNSDFAEMSITNFSRRDGNLLQFEFDVRRDVDGADVIKAISDLAKKFRDDYRIQKDSVSVQVREKPEGALQLEIRAHSLLADWSNFLEMRHTLLSELRDTLKARKILQSDGEVASS